MEAEGSASKVSDARATSSVLFPAPIGSTPGTPETSCTKTQKEILRERYLKGVKKRKCAVCGNTARARCPFRACKTCCNKMKNACEVHANKSKQASNPPALDPHDSRWAGAMNAMPCVSTYATPLYMSSAACNGVQTAMAAYRVCYTPFQSRHVATGQYAAQNARSCMVSQATLEQQEHQRLKNVKAAIQAANWEAQIASIWKTQKMIGFFDGELPTEDDAFDRYMLNMAFLEDVFLATRAGPTGLSPDGKLLVGRGETLNEIDEIYVSDTLVVVGGLRLRRGMKAPRKDAGRSRLKITIDRSLQVLKRGQHVVDDFADEDDFKQGLLLGRRRDVKRYKATIKEGKNCLKRVDLFDTLLQKTSQIHSRADIESCGEMYRQYFGRGLLVLLPHLSRNVENILGCRIRKVNGDSAIPSETPSIGDMLDEASASKDSIPTPTAADSKEDGIADKFQNSRVPGQYIEANDLGEQGRYINRYLAKSSPHVKWRGMSADTTGSSASVEEWRKLHEGSLAGRGWWKVEVDELSAQIACQHLLTSNQAVELCKF